MNKLHIGYHKTGTTFLQQKIFPNCKNYVGRFYNDKSKNGIHDFKFMGTEAQSKKLISELIKYNNVFYSNETFSKLTHDKLIKILGKNKFDILITLRLQTDLLYSRANHTATDFYLTPSIVQFYKSKNITNDIIQHYNFTKLIKLLRENGHTVTYIWYEDIFSLNEKAIQILSNYLKINVYDIIKKNINNKINKGNKSMENKIDISKYFNNDKLNYNDIT